MINYFFISPEVGLNGHMKTSSMYGTTFEEIFRFLPIIAVFTQVCDTYDRASVRFAGPEVTWYRPVRLSELLALRKLHPSASLIAGFTGSGTLRHGTSCHGMACHGTSRHGTSCHGMSCHGTSCNGTSHHGMSRHGLETPPPILS